MDLMFIMACSAFIIILGHMHFVYLSAAFLFAAFLVLPSKLFVGGAGDNWFWIILNEMTFFATIVTALGDNSDVHNI